MRYSSSPTNLGYRCLRASSSSVVDRRCVGFAPGTRMSACHPERTLGQRCINRELRNMAALVITSVISSAREWRIAQNDLAPGVRGQSKQWLTDLFSHQKSVVLHVNSTPYGQSDPDFLIRESAQNGARRLTDGPSGMGKPKPPPCSSHRQALSRLGNARTGCSRPKAVIRFW